MQNFVIGDQDKLDGSKKMAMEDSTAMTIEFLRARLLAERSISRTARQRADELAKRVLELEEQLKLVAVQRKKAEKATSEVLTILENQGISDLSEVYDSSSEQEGVGSESEEIDDNPKEDLNLTNSRLTEVKDAEPSGLDLEVPPLIGRSLSWKSYSDGPNSLENAKYLDETRRHSSLSSTGGSCPRHQLGKSCRQIKQREARSLEVEVNEESLLGAQEIAVARWSGDASHCTSDIPKILNQERDNGEDKIHIGNSVQGSLEDKENEANNSYILDSERSAEMERALEHQARLIGRFEAEENTQREWEEKFKGTSCNSPDSCEHGNHSDITEERDDIRAGTSEAVDTSHSLERGKSRMDHVHNTGEVMTKDHPSRFPHHQHQDNTYSQKQKYIISTVDPSQSTFSEFSFPGQENLEAQSNEKHNPKWSETNSFCSFSYEPPGHQAAQFPSLHSGSGTYKGESSGNKLQVKTHHESSNGLGGVLDALQQAKLSLKHELNRLSSSAADGRIVRRTESPGDNMEIPGLFRVPAGQQFDAPVRPKSLPQYPDPELGLARYYPALMVGPDSASSPYSDRSSVNSTRTPTPTPTPLIDPYMDKGMGLPSSIFMYPSYVDQMPRMPSNDAFTRTYPSMGLEMASGGRYSEYNDRIRRDMYKR